MRRLRLIAIASTILLTGCVTDEQALREALDRAEKILTQVETELEKARELLDENTLPPATYHVDAAAHAPVVHYGPSDFRWTTVGISPNRGLDASAIHTPTGFEIAYGVARNEGIDMAWARTREQQAVRVQQAQDELERYIRTFQGRQLTTFDAPPMVKIDRANPAWAEVALTAIQSVNAALPDEFKMRLADRGVGDAQDGEIVIDFRPRAQWPTPILGPRGWQDRVPDAALDPRRPSQLAVWSPYLDRHGFHGSIVGSTCPRDDRSRTDARARAVRAP